MDSGGQLPEVKRHVATHNDQGQAIHSDALPEGSPTQPRDNEVGYALSYACEGLPVDLNNSADIDTYKRYRENAPGLVVPNGTVLRHVDFAPGVKHVMHRTFEWPL